MMNRSFEMLKNVAKSAADTTINLAEKGKKRLDLYTLEDMLRKTQMKLGQLAYGQQKTGVQNPELFAKHVQRIDLLKTQIAAHGKTAESDVDFKTHTSTKNEATENAMFCGSSSEELP